MTATPIAIRISADLSCMERVCDAVLEVSRLPLSDAAENIIQEIAGLFERRAQVAFDLDSAPAARAGELRVFFNPSDRLRDLAAALGALDSKFSIVEQSLDHAASSAGANEPAYPTVESPQGTPEPACAEGASS